MGEVVDLETVRTNRLMANMMDNINRSARDTALLLWSHGHRSVTIEAIVEAEEICRSNGFSEETISNFSRLLGRLTHKHLMALYPTHLQR